MSVVEIGRLQVAGCLVEGFQACRRSVCDFFSCFLLFWIFLHGIQLFVAIFFLDWFVLPCVCAGYFDKDPVRG